MSNITEHNTQILQAALNTQFIDACINFASLSFYLFDFCLTFDLQIDFMWGRKWSITTLLFLLLHFSVVLSQISDAAGPFLSCKRYWGHGYLAIAALRIFAINGKHWLLPTIIVILSLPQVIANIYEIINTHIMFFSQNICAPAYSNAWTMVEWVFLYI
ncbi:hypothetical protein FOMPIDRAFT_1016093 [Fomitopsis schrenkii]|uniref:DUF6533 domain-containing protein n=1 Tax=Fomitopsis schrenkii TaxID=2126942 RepID=S8E7T1_FOMSC|nr:hypothetical protein FOMPIDRAFT_1016093 [Fomitopsis schrenkii]